MLLSFWIMMMMMMLQVLLVFLCHIFLITLNDSCVVVVVVVTAFAITTTTTPFQQQLHSCRWQFRHWYNDHPNVPMDIIRRSSSSSVSWFQRRVVTTPTTTSVTCTTNSESSSSQPQKLFIFGLGRVGQQVAQYHQQQQQSHHNEICGTVRNVTKAAMMRTTTTTTFMDQQDTNVDITNNRDIRMIPWTGSGGRNDDNHDDMIIQEIKNGTTHVLITIPPDPICCHNDQYQQRYFDQLVDTIIRHNTMIHTPEIARCNWIGIISTTGVYGNHNGLYVTEESECLVTAAAVAVADQNDTALSKSSSQLLYLSYEEAWKRRLQRHPNNITLCIFRCAGIYSNDRSALHTVYNKANNGIHQMVPTTSTATNNTGASSATTTGTSNSDNKNDNYDDITNRIHVDDLAAAISAAMMMTPATSSTVKVYNLADDRPESRTVVMQYAAQLLAPLLLLPTTRTRRASGSDAAPEIATTGRIRDQRRKTDQKRIDNTKMKQELIPQLKFPTYIEGLNDILQYPNNPWWTNSSSNRQSSTT